MTKLVRMTKNGETLAVHETTVAAHQRAGWAVSTDQSNTEAPEAKQDAGEAKTPAEVLAMADDGTPFMAFKSAAGKLLGDKLPAKKDEIVLALMELATDPE